MAYFPREVYLTVVADTTGRAAEYEFHLSFRKLTEVEVREQKRQEELEDEKKAA